MHEVLNYLANYILYAPLPPPPLHHGICYTKLRNSLQLKQKTVFWVSILTVFSKMSFSKLYTTTHKQRLHDHSEEILWQIGVWREPISTTGVSRSYLQKRRRWRPQPCWKDQRNMCKGLSDIHLSWQFQHWTLAPLELGQREAKVAWSSLSNAVWVTAFEVVLISVGKSI